MNARVDHLLDEALALPIDERSVLVLALLDSLEGSSDPSVSEAWRLEIARRRAGLRNGDHSSSSLGRSQIPTRRLVTRFQVFVLPDAEAEIGAAYSWYHERNPQAAETFRTEAFEAIDLLADSPTKWKLNDDGTHRIVLRHFPYTVFFEVKAKPFSSWP